MKVTVGQQNTGDILNDAPMTMSSMEFEMKTTSDDFFKKSGGNVFEEKKEVEVKEVKEEKDEGLSGSSISMIVSLIIFLIIASILAYMYFSSPTGKVTTK